VSKITAQNIESMISLVKPKDIKFDIPQADIDITLIPQTCLDSETPTLNNLSRMDETFVCVEHEQTKQPRGWDLTVRLAAATTLAHIAYGSTTVSSDDSTALVLSWISNALNDFLADYHNMDVITSFKSMSLDRTKRLFRLLVAMNIPENEPYLVDIVHASKYCYRREVLRAKESRQETLRELNMVRVQQKRLEKEKKDILDELNSQSIAFQHYISRLKASVAQETRQIVSIHSMERCKAEKNAEAAVNQMNLAAAELEKVIVESKVLRDAISLAHTDLELASSKMDDLNATANVLRQQVDGEKEKNQDISNKLRVAHAQIESNEQKFLTLSEVVNQRENVIKRVEDSNHQLHENLEDLFADMCSLSEVFQQLEDHAHSQNQKSRGEVRAMKQKLEAEQRTRAELDSKVKILVEENDKLNRKLAKYKERLEQERKERHQEQERRNEVDYQRKRNGPVSYLNSLHSSSAFDMCTRHSGSSRDRSSTQSHARDRCMADKENDGSDYYTNASQRRGAY
jgi:regulator of replication initiation timing